MVNIVWEEQKDKQCQRSNKLTEKQTNFLYWGACSEEVVFHTSVYDVVMQQTPINFIIPYSAQSHWWSRCNSMLSDSAQCIITEENQECSLIVYFGSLPF